MPVEVLREIRERLPEVRLWNFYGQTEMSPLATILGPDEQLSHAGSAGRAALNVETRIVDDDDREVPAGTVGEIVHRSPHATLGYYADEAKTAEAFRDGWFHSGDLGYVDDDGRLYVVDRKKDMIKTGGENVASREVEEAIYALDGVAEVAVFGVSHPRWVEAVAAVVVPQAGATLDLRAGADAHPRGAGRLQDAQVRRDRRRPAQEPERQDPQAGAARRSTPTSPRTTHPSERARLGNADDGLGQLVGHVHHRTVRGLQPRHLVGLRGPLLLQGCGQGGVPGAHHVGQAAGRLRRRLLGEPNDAKDWRCRRGRKPATCSRSASAHITSRSSSTSSVETDVGLAGVHPGRRRAVPEQVQEALPTGGQEGREVDPLRHRRVVGQLGQDHAAVGVPDQADGTLDPSSTVRT